MLLATSILDIKESKQEKIDLLNKTTTSFLHLDIMDGFFVPNQAGDIEELKELLKTNHKPIDIHFMVNEVQTYVEVYQVLNPSYMTFHIEAPVDTLKMIQLIKSKQIKVGLSIKPNTSLESLIDYLPHIDLVLLMSVEPGYGGQTFIAETENRIKYLKEYREKNNLAYLIEVDGGINNITIDRVRDTDIAVVGSFIVKHDNYQQQIDQLRFEV